MKIALVLAGLLAVTPVASALAAGPYLGLSGGAAFFHDSDLEEGLGTATASYDTGYAVSGAGGYDFGHFRLEGEVGYRKADVNKISYLGFSVPVTGDFSVLSFMVNSYYDLKNSTPFTPFVGAGIGGLYGKATDGGESADDFAFGYQVTAGGSYSLTRNLNLDLSYRFQGAAPDFTIDGTSFSYHSSNILAGVRYTFQ